MQPHQHSTLRHIDDSTKNHHHSTIRLYSTVLQFDYPSIRPITTIRLFNDSIMPTVDYLTIRRFDDSTIPPLDKSTIRLFNHTTIRLVHDSTLPSFDYSAIRPYLSLTIRRLHHNTNWLCDVLTEDTTLPPFDCSIFRRFNQKPPSDNSTMQPYYTTRLFGDSIIPPFDYLTIDGSTIPQIDYLTFWRYNSVRLSPFDCLTIRPKTTQPKTTIRRIDCSAVLKFDYPSIRPYDHSILRLFDDSTRILPFDYYAIQPGYHSTI